MEMGCVCVLGGGGEDIPERRASFVHFGLFEEDLAPKRSQGIKSKKNNGKPQSHGWSWVQTATSWPGGGGAVLCFVCFVLERWCCRLQVLQAAGKRWGSSFSLFSVVLLQCRPSQCIDHDMMKQRRPRRHAGTAAYQRPHSVIDKGPPGRWHCAAQPCTRAIVWAPRRRRSEVALLRRSAP
jgi:hypothetical protein